MLPEPIPAWEEKKTIAKEPKTIPVLQMVQQQLWIYSGPDWDRMLKKWLPLNTKLSLEAFSEELCCPKDHLAPVYILSNGGKHCVGNKHGTI